VTQAPDVAAICERLREQGVDVVRVSYPDMIGVDRGRDVLLDELPTAVGHGLAFCRAVYHTSPMGDVVPVQGGLEMGLPDITVYPDLATLTPLPWDPSGRPPVSAIAIRVPLPGTTFINAANEAEFPLPIVEGDRLTVVEEVVSVSPEKQTKLGVGHFIETLDTFTRQDGAVVATNRNTLFRFTPAATS